METKSNLFIIRLLQNVHKGVYFAFFIGNHFGSFDEGLKMANLSNKLKLHGFNNLTKSLSFNIYDICYAKTSRHRSEYIAYIDEAYNAERLTDILSNVAYIIGAEILNVARQDYEPQGASVTALIAEGPVTSPKDIKVEAPGPRSEAVVAHLNKSHIAVHTYPESHPENGICTFRADIDVATCGLVSPLKALNYLIHCFDSDVVAVDYRVRGFTRDIDGTKHYIDHEIHSIQNFFPEDTRACYEMLDVNVREENIFHTKMLLKSFDINNYLFGTGAGDFTAEELALIKRRLRKEMQEIFQSRNLTTLKA